MTIGVLSVPQEASTSVYSQLCSIKFPGDPNTIGPQNTI